MRGRFTSVAVICALLMLLGQSAMADTPRERLARAQDRLDELSRELEIQIEECNLRREQLKAAKRAVQDNRAEYSRTESALESVDDERGVVVAEMYKQGVGGQQLATLATSVDSLTEYAERVAWLDITQEARSSAFERYAATREQLAASGELLRRTEARAAEANRTAQRSCDATREKVEAEQDRIEELAAEVERLEAAARRRSAANEPSSEPASDPASSTPVAAPAASGSAGAAVQFALAQVGKPYCWGGSGPSCYDCSGLTSAAWASAGVSLPHSSSMQYSATSRVSRDALQPGDLLFFGSPIHHVAMYVGNGQMVEAPRSGLTVRVVSTDRSDYVGAGRP